MDESLLEERYRLTNELGWTKFREFYDDPDLKKIENQKIEIAQELIKQGDLGTVGFLLALYDNTKPINDLMDTVNEVDKDALKGEFMGKSILGHIFNPKLKHRKGIEKLRKLVIVLFNIPHAASDMEFQRIAAEKGIPIEIIREIKDYNFGKSKRKTKKLRNKKKVPKRLKSRAKKLGIRLTVKRNGKRVPKSSKVLKRQIRLKSR